MTTEPSTHDDLPQVNGICPNCGNPSHWANAVNGYVHPDCEAPA